MCEFATGNERHSSLSQFIDPVHVREGVDIPVAKRARYPLQCFPRETFLSDLGPKLTSRKTTDLLRYVR